MYFWGFDLGDGESTISRAEDNNWNTPEIMEINGEKIILSVWALMQNGEVCIGEKAARSAHLALRSSSRFKGRFFLSPSETAGILRDFSAKILAYLRDDNLLSDGANRFYIGCPAGWDTETRQSYLDIFTNLDCPSPALISESRAVMVGAVQSNSLRDYVDVHKKSVLVIDIGSSTTDFAYIQKGKESEIRTGGEVRLGGGIMDELLFDACLSASKDHEKLEKIFKESDTWRIDCELRIRRLKEEYYTLVSGTAPEKRKDICLEDSLLITYEDPLLFDLRMDLSVSDRLINAPCPQLGGISFCDAFCQALRQVKENISSSLPEMIFLTGGVSRMPIIREWCHRIFPKAAIYSDKEPEFSVARGLAWCGRIDKELAEFRQKVEELISSDTVETIVSKHLNHLYKSALENLLNPILQKAVKPVLLDWREGKIEKLASLEPALQENIRIFLHSEEAKNCLYEPVGTWIRNISDELEEYTLGICRKYHVPEHSLKISATLSPSDLSVLGNLDTNEVFYGQTFTEAALFVESIISVIVGLLCGGGGIALISSGPVGIAAGIILSATILGVGTVLGRKTVDDKLLNANLPLPVRKMALSKSLPRLDGADIDLKKSLKKIKDFSKYALTGNKETKTSTEFETISLDVKNGSLESQPDKKKRLHFLPHLAMPDSDDISEHRMNSIRNKIRAEYEALFDDQTNEDIRNLNDKMCREISDQIEHLLKELARQVEIPL